MNRRMVCSLWSCPYVDWVALDADQIKKELLEALKLLDAKDGEFGLSKVEMSERVVVRSQIGNLLSLEEISWR